jgi:hypothetical protein
LYHVETSMPSKNVETSMGNEGSVSMDLH